MSSGYTSCACRDCFEIAISSNVDEPELCGDCEDAGCDPEGESECCCESAYGCGEDFEGDSFDSPAHDEGE
jgi:hypothetical protein